MTGEFLQYAISPEIYPLFLSLFLSFFLNLYSFCLILVFTIPLEKTANYGENTLQYPEPFTNEIIFFDWLIATISPKSRL